MGKVTIVKLLELSQLTYNFSIPPLPIMSFSKLTKSYRISFGTNVRE